MNTMDKPVMLDTNAFNEVLDEKVSLDAFSGRRLLVIGVQADELRATADVERRKRLLAVFEEISPTCVPASSFTWGIEGAGFDQAYWNDGSGLFEKMLARLRELDSKKKKKDPLNQLRDILIGETAIKNSATLVSGDKDLRQVVLEFGASAVDPVDLASGTI